MKMKDDHRYAKLTYIVMYIIARPQPYIMAEHR